MYFLFLVKLSITQIKPTTMAAPEVASIEEKIVVEQNDELNT